MAEKSATHEIAARAERILRQRGAEAAHEFIVCTLRRTHGETPNGTTPGGQA